MVRRQNIQSKPHRLVKKVSRQPSEETSSPPIKHTLSENLDDETKLAKRHLTKEMWQLVSIAVKRMADELVTISTNQQTTTRTSSQDLQTSTVPHNQSPTTTETNKVSIQPSSIVQQPMSTNLGAGDVLLVKEKASLAKQALKRRTLPIQLLEPSLPSKRKGTSNNATPRRMKSNKSSKSAKKNAKPKMIKRLRKN